MPVIDVRNILLSSTIQVFAVEYRRETQNKQEREKKIFSHCARVLYRNRKCV